MPPRDFAGVAGFWTSVEILAWNQILVGAPLLIPIVAAALCLGIYWCVNRVMRERGLKYWLGTYVAERSRRGRPAPDQETHLLLCVADHYEPRFGNASPERAKSRVDRWRNEFPQQFARFRDSDGRSPKHTFFYPPEHYEPQYLDSLRELCVAGFGEVEVHLHHDHDTADALRQKLLEYVNLLSERHGLLSRPRQSKRLAYGFVHGDWALDNSHPQGLHCGVNNELDVLRETGCFADFTLPSAPSPTQTRKINSIYYACDDPIRPKSHDWGTDVGTSPAPERALMIIQGPLLFDWSRRKFGLLPRIENGYLQANQPPSPHRIDLWLNARVRVANRPDWFFAKLHSHGATEWHADALLGLPMLRLHEALMERAARDAKFKFHYVSAREMFNLARAAETGWKGSVDQARDFELLANWQT
jgi:hypothetical protein